MPTPTRRIARRLTALGTTVGLAAVFVSTTMASGATPGDLGNPSLQYRSTSSLPPGAEGVVFETLADTPASAVGVMAYFSAGATVTAEIRDVTNLTTDTAPGAAVTATVTARVPASQSFDFRDIPLPPGFVFHAGERYDIRFLVDGGWPGNPLEYQKFDKPDLRSVDGFDAPPFRVLDGGCGNSAGVYSYRDCFVLPHVHVVLGAGDTKPPTVDVRVVGDDRPDGTFYNIASSGTDGVQLEVSAADESGIASLTCRDGDVALFTTTESVASITLDDGDHFVSCAATDVPGNVGSTARPAEFHIDQTPPDLAPTVSPNPVREGQPADAYPHAADQRGILWSGCDTVRTDVIGRHEVTCSATDGAGNSATADAEYDVEHAFDGFFSPVRMGETNRVKAGSSVPLKFSIGEYDGLDLLAGGSPSVRLCHGGGEAAPAAGRLSYDADAAQYVYLWKTDRAWAGSCREITVRLDDGSAKSVSFGMT